MKKYSIVLIAASFMVAGNLSSMELSLTKKIRLGIELTEGEKKEIGFSFLKSAAWSGNLDEVKTYLKYGGRTDEKGRTALMHQFLPHWDGCFDFDENDREIAKLLLTVENANIVDNVGMTALMYALNRALGHQLEINFEFAIPIVEALLDSMNTAAINQQNKQGETALSLASKIRNGSKIVKLLLEKGADPRIVPTLQGQSSEDARALAYLRALTSLGSSATAELLKERFKAMDPKFAERVRIFAKQLTFESGL